MAKAKTVEEDLDDLDLDDLDELDETIDEDVEVEEEDDEDEDPDEAPKARKRKGKKTKAAKPKKEKSGIGTPEVAEAAGVTPRELRQYLRASGYQPRDDREGRYNWPSLRDPEVREIVKAIKGGAVAKQNKEKLDDLKAKKKSKKTSVKKTTKKKTRKRKVADEDDE